MEPLHLRDSPALGEARLHISPPGGEGATYQVKNRADKRQRLSILTDVSAYFSPVEMSAVMGPSGSGKSTLLDLIAGRKTIGELQGDILFSGIRPTQAFLRRYTGYVEQFDTMLPELSVREMLLYTAELKCALSEPLAGKRQRVAALLERLALQTCADTTIGDALSRGISGGQAKRTNIGIAMITNPRVLFLDEPTSGLDSYTAHEVMRVTQSLARGGITVCATIHCPPPHTFALFDRLLVLQRGRMVYFGANGLAASAYFHGVPTKVQEKRADENLADWIVHITTDADRQGSDAFVQAYARSALKEQTATELREMLKLDGTSVSQATLSALGTKEATVTPLWKGLWVMLKYRSRNNYVCGNYLFGRLFDKTCFAFLTATFYWRTGAVMNSTNAPNLAGLLFMWAILPAYGAGPYLPAIVLERPVYVREISDGLYTAFTYLLYKMIEELVMAVLMSIAFALPVYYICDLHGSFFLVWLIWLVSLADGIAFAYATAALSPTLDIANAVLLTLPTALLFAAGYLLRWRDIPRYWIWFGYVNWLWYAWGALMINTFKGSGIDIFGEDILAYYSLDGISEWAFLGYEALSFIVYAAIAYIGLVSTLRLHQKR
ncbi:hypothetical protein WJX81_004187 [Elliptochloris bilobata]|uniref:ABC transporter domain-containing protein n=1 Tax=Elliptochloris bilobata TaxID=381761 RepID=A0AAW1SGB2_9CHLO